MVNGTKVLSVNQIAAKLKVDELILRKSFFRPELSKPDWPIHKKQSGAYKVKCSSSRPVKVIRSGR